MLEDRGNIDAVGIVDSPVNVRDRHDFIACLVEQLSADSSDIAGSLNHDSRVLRRHPKSLDRFINDEQECRALLLRGDRTTRPDQSAFQ